jgi:hypothetical protein
VLVRPKQALCQLWKLDCFHWTIQSSVHMFGVVGEWVYILDWDMADRSVCREARSVERRPIG